MAEEKKELVAINVPIFADFKGRTIDRDFRIKDTNYKLTFSLPVPDSLKEVATMYDVPEDEVLAIAVKQISYNRDTELRNWLTEEGKNVNWENPPINEIAEKFETSLKKAPERKVSEKTKKAKEAQAKLAKLEGLLAKFGVSSLEELEEKLHG